MRRILIRDVRPTRGRASLAGLQQWLAAYAFFTPIPTNRAELGRIGGRRNRRQSAGDIVHELPKLETATAVRDTVSRLIAEVYAGRVQPRLAAGLAPLMNLLLRTIKTTNFEEQIATLEKRLVAADMVEGKHGE